MTKKMPATIRNIAIAKKSNQRRTSMLGSDTSVGVSPDAQPILSVAVQPMAFGARRFRA